MYLILFDRRNYRTVPVKRAKDGLLTTGPRFAYELATKWPVDKCLTWNIKGNVVIYSHSGVARAGRVPRLQNRRRHRTDEHWPGPGFIGVYKRIFERMDSVRQCRRTGKLPRPPRVKGSRPIRTWNLIKQIILFRCLFRSISCGILPFIMCLLKTMKF